MGILEQILNSESTSKMERVCEELEFYSSYGEYDKFPKLTIGFFCEFKEIVSYYYSLKTVDPKKDIEDVKKKLKGDFQRSYSCLIRIANAMNYLGNIDHDKRDWILVMLAGLFYCASKIPDISGVNKRKMRNDGKKIIKKINGKLRDSFVVKYLNGLIDGNLDEDKTCINDIKDNEFLKTIYIASTL